LGPFRAAPVGLRMTTGVESRGVRTLKERNMGTAILRSIRTLAAAALLAAPSPAFAQVYSQTELPAFPGWTRSYGVDVNDSGHVAGFAEVGFFYFHACVWIGGTPVDIGSCFPYTSEAEWINDLGQVVGSYLSDPFGEDRGFFWDGVTCRD